MVNKQEEALNKIIVFNQSIGIIRYVGPVADDSGFDSNFNIRNKVKVKIFQIGCF